MLYLSKPDKKHRTWRVRGTYLEVTVERSTGATDKKIAQKELAAIREDIERGRYAKDNGPTWAGAVISYVQARGDRQSRILERLTRHFGDKPLKEFSQADVDAAAHKLYPAGKPPTRNRSVYTPVMAVMNHAGVPFLRTPDGGHRKLSRPEGAQGDPRLVWLEIDEAFSLLDAARARAMHQQHLLQREHPGWQTINLTRAADSARRLTAFVLFLLCTGVRYDEANRIMFDDINLAEARAWCGKTKNGQPRAIYLPKPVVDELRTLTPRPDGRVFPSYHQRHLWRLAELAGVHIPDGVAWHIFRHTWAKWMRQYAGLDTSGLVATGAWRSHSAARVYEHLDITVEARKADLLPLIDGRMAGDEKSVA